MVDVFKFLVPIHATKHRCVKDEPVSHSQLLHWYRSQKTLLRA